MLIGSFTDGARICELIARRHPLADLRVVDEQIANPLWQDAQPRISLQRDRRRSPGQKCRGMTAGIRFCAWVLELAHVGIRGPLFNTYLFVIERAGSLVSSLVKGRPGGTGSTGLRWSVETPRELRCVDLRDRKW